MEERLTLLITEKKTSQSEKGRKKARSHKREKTICEKERKDPVASREDFCR